MYPEIQTKFYRFFSRPACGLVSHQAPPQKQQNLKPPRWMPLGRRHVLVTTCIHYLHTIQFKNKNSIDDGCTYQTFS